jgi:hypothetical protein
MPKVGIYSGCPMIAAGLAGLLPGHWETFIADSFAALNTWLTINQPELAIIDVDASFSIEKLHKLRENSPFTNPMVLVKRIPHELLAHIVFWGSWELQTRIRAQRNCRPASRL